MPGPEPVPAVPAATHYATRNDAFSPATTWVIEGTQLRAQDAGGPPRVVALADVVEVRLTFAPTRSEPNRYRCTLLTRSGGRLGWFNRTYQGLGDFRDTSTGYTEFVRALHAALVRHAPACRFVAGASPARYAVSVGATAFVALVIVVAALFLVINGLAWLILLKLVLLAVFLPNAVRWLARNRPRPYASGAIPPELLPDGRAA